MKDQILSSRKIQKLRWYWNFLIEIYYVKINQESQTGYHLLFEISLIFLLPKIREIIDLRMFQKNFFFQIIKLIKLSFSQNSRPSPQNFLIPFFQRISSKQYPRLKKIIWFVCFGLRAYFFFFKFYLVNFFSLPHCLQTKRKSTPQKICEQVFFALFFSIHKERVRKVFVRKDFSRSTSKEIKIFLFRKKKKMKHLS